SLFFHFTSDCELKKVNFYFKFVFKNLRCYQKLDQFLVTKALKLVANNKKSSRFFITQLDNFFIGYNNSSIDLGINSKTEYSKTLALNRQFFNLHFKNFYLFFC